MSGRHPDDFSELAQLLAEAEASTDRQFSTRLDPDVIAARKRKQRRRRIIAGVIALTIVGLVGTYLPLVLVTPVGDAELQQQDVAIEAPAAVVIALPASGASAVSVSGAEQYPGTTGVDGILAASGGNDPRSIASITKLIAALVILDAKPLALGDDGPTITFTEADEDLYDHYYVQGATIQPLEGGSTLSLRDALEVMLIPSATNYADAVSRWVFGSRDAFRRAAATWLAAHGFTGTTIVEPTGMDPRNRSTPTELVAIARLAVANPVIASIVRMPYLDVPTLDSEPNTNSLVGDHGITGLKTGTLDEAGSCLLFSAEFNVGFGSPISVVGVVLGSGSRESANAEVLAMLESIRSGFHQVTPVSRGDVFGTLTTPWGEEAKIIAEIGATVFNWSDMPISIDVDIDPVSTGEEGTRVGTVTVTSGDSVDSSDLVLDRAIAGPDGWWRLTHPAEVFGLD